MKNLVLLPFIFLSFTLKAQIISSTLPNGNVTITQDTMIKVLLDYSDSIAVHKLSVQGYRVQLTTNSNRKSVLDMKAQFTMQFPNVKAYIEYQQPTFKLRVGDFESRISAYAFQQEILNSFPNAFIVQDNISLGDQ